VEQGLQNGKKQGGYNQQNTEERNQDDQVPQGMTNGHLVVLGHYYKEIVLYTTKYQNKTDLGEASSVRDALSLCLDVHQHLWDCGGAYTGVSE
jgi:hypothetical protein